jgi:hypothetical protein
MKWDEEENEKVTNTTYFLDGIHRFWGFLIKIALSSLHNITNKQNIYIYTYILIKNDPGIMLWIKLFFSFISTMKKIYI